jgi:LAS superfamily LD-carboxypeptidase LdcB
VVLWTHVAFPVVAVSEPAALRGHENGKLPDSILGTVKGQAGGAPVTLLKDSSLRAWVALCAAARAEGHILKTNQPTSSYRTYAEQLAIWTRRMSTTRWPGATKSRWWNGQLWWLKPGDAAVAPPGSSYHSRALAVDAGEERDADLPNEPFDNDTLEWLRLNAVRFGWSWEL